MARGLYYGSYRAPRVMLWSVGVIIFLVMMGAIEGEVPKMFYLIREQGILINNDTDYLLGGLREMEGYLATLGFSKPRVRANKRIGPHDMDILSIIYGTLLGVGTLYNVKGNIRLRVEQVNKELLNKI